MIAIIFAIFLVLNALSIFSTMPEMRHKVAVELGLSLLWTTVFLGAIWQGQNWARYVLGVLLLLSIVYIIFATIPTFFEYKMPLPLMVPIMLVAYLAMFLILTFNKDISKHVHSR